MMEHIKLLKELQAKGFNGLQANLIRGVCILLLVRWAAQRSDKELCACSLEFDGVSEKHHKHMITHLEQYWPHGDGDGNGDGDGTGGGGLET